MRLSTRLRSYGMRLLGSQGFIEPEPQRGPRPPQTARRKANNPLLSSGGRPLQFHHGAAATTLRLDDLAGHRASSGRRAQ